MPRAILPFCCCFLFLSGCKPPEESPLKAVVGAVLFDGTGGPPVSASVVTVEGSRIRAVGTRTTLPVPAAAEKIDASGKFLVPGLIDLDARLDSSGRPAIRHSLDGYLRGGVTGMRSAALTGDTLAIREQERQGTLAAPRLFLAGRARGPGDVSQLAAQRVDAIEAVTADPALLEGILDESRRYRIPVVAAVSTLAGWRTAVNNGAAGILGIPCDTEAIDPAFIARLRDLRMIVAPSLASLDGVRLAIAGRNTKRLEDGGVLLGVASGGDTLRELELLAGAGLSPSDLIAAATRNGALALGQPEQLGGIEPGKRADLLLLSANPAEDIRNLRKIDRIMLDGQWIEPER